MVFHCWSSELSSAFSSFRSLVRLSCSRLISISSSLRKRPQPHVEDRLGLHVGELERLHQLRLRLVLLADDADDLVDVEIGDEIAVEHLEAVVDLVQAELRAADQHDLAMLEPFAQAPRASRARSAPTPRLSTFMLSGTRVSSSVSLNSCSISRTGSTLRLFGSSTRRTSSATRRARRRAAAASSAASARRCARPAAPSAPDTGISVTTIW